MAQDKDTEAAQRGAESWLAVIDNGDYAVSYAEAASIFKAAITNDDWVQKVRAVRGPLGKVASRRLKSAQYKTSLPGAPDGKYVVIQYDTSFENKQIALETVALKKESDGAWRVSGYFIK